MTCSAHLTSATLLKKDVTHMTIQANYSLDLLSLLQGSTASSTAATTSTTNFSDVLSSYIQQSGGTTDISSVIAGFNTTNATDVASLLGTNSTYSYYLNSLLSGSNGTGTEAMQTYLAQSSSSTDATSITSLFGDTTNNSSSSTLSNMLMASYEAKQLQTVAAAQNQYKTQLASLQQGEQTAAVQDRISKLNSNAAALQNYVQNTLTNKAQLSTASNFSGVFNSISALQNDILAKYEAAQKAPDAQPVQQTTV